MSFGYRVLGFGSGGGAGPYNVQYLVVGVGAGGGGGHGGGGGGAGGYRTISTKAFEVDASNKYHKYKANIKLAKVTKIAKYLLVKLESDLDLEKKINNEPSIGKRIKEDKIGKSIILKFKKLIKLKNLKAL